LWDKIPATTAAWIGKQSPTEAPRKSVVAMAWSNGFTATVRHSHLALIRWGLFLLVQRLKTSSDHLFCC